MIHEKQTVAEIVLEHSECAPVFQRHRIDYCCHGDRPLALAAAERDLDLPALIRELNEAVANRTGGGDVDPRTLSSPALVGLIVSRHHEYLRKAMPFVVGLSQKVARVHGDGNGKLLDLEGVVSALTRDLEEHLDREEQVLFPALLAGKDTGVIRDELASMQDDHHAVARLLESMRAATDDFSVPQWACNSYRTLFRELEEMEADILRHVHLENHVLMPRYT